MKIELLNRRIDSEHNQKLTKAYNNMDGLINALNKKEIPEADQTAIYDDIKTINSFLGTEKELIKLLKKTYTKTLSEIEKKLNLVTKSHYQQLWMVYGMFVGLLFSTVFGNFFESVTWASYPMGLSMGMLFGLLAGKNRDKTSEKEGLQLDI